MNATRLSSKANSNIIRQLGNVVCCVSLIVMLVSCSSLDDRQESLAQFGRAEFDPDVWAISNESVRGTMIHDFLMKNAPISSKDRNFVIRQLGNGTAYFEYDLNPAYFIGSHPKGGQLKAYLIAFIIEQKTGKVRDIQVHPQLEGAHFYGL